MRCKFYIYIVVLLLISSKLSFAEINFSIVKRDVACNFASLGSVEVNVVSTNPPYTYQWNIGNTTHIVNDLQPGVYWVAITDGAGNDTLVYVTVNEIKCQIAPEIVFTPNGDGYNDNWAIGNIQFYPENLILLYNRWGQKVYEHEGIYEPWDGKDLLGIPVPDGVYFYVIYHDKKDKKSIVKSTVSVVR